jgi:NAD-dependent dihydropyrimidine dehydrogenase PreA subunit
MITIDVDEQACVSCEMCVEACPTNVYRFDAGKGAPEVQKPLECFGCLACARICPADAIAHQGLQKSLHFYHDPYALALASKLTGAPQNGSNCPQDDASVQIALDDLGVRLLALAAVLRSTLSSGLPGVGTFAGRMLARQLPRYKPPATFEETVALAREQFAPAWDLEPEIRGDTLLITVKGCFLRELCAKQKMALGGDICTLFYNYLAGYLNGMGKVRLRLVNATRDWDQCTYETKVHA